MYNISSNNKSFLKPKDYWDTLSLREKAAMISIAVKNGIYNIEDVRNEYNELAANDVNIYDGIDESTNQMQVQNKSFVDNTIPIIYNTDADKPIYINSTTGDVWQSGKPIGSFVLPEVTITAPNPKNEKHRVEDFIQNIIPTGKEIARQNIRDYLTESNDNAWVDIPLTYRKKNPHLEERVIKGADGHNAWVKEHPVADAIGNIAASVPFAVASYPLWGSAVIAGGDALAASTLGKVITKGLTNPYTDAFITSAFGAHGLNHAINEGINGWGDAAMTALDVAPLGRLARPIYEGVVQPGMRLLNSPLTGNWTQIGSKEYRLAPGYVGMNGTPVESRAAGSTPKITITAENADKIPLEEWSRQYRAAEATGDMKEGQRLWDLWFKMKAPNTKIITPEGTPLKTYHGGQRGITSFYNPNENPAFKSNNFYRDPSNRVGIYTSDELWYAKQYARGYPKADRKVYELYLNHENPREVSYWESQKSRLKNLNPFKKERALNPSIIRPEDKARLLPNNDGLKWDIERATFDGRNIKSAEPFTYADDGSLIDITERANFGKNDIRYAWPWRKEPKGTLVEDFTDFNTMIERMNSTVEYAGTNPFKDGKMTGFRKWALDNGAAPEKILELENKYSKDNWKALKEYTRVDADASGGGKGYVQMYKNTPYFNQTFPHEVEHRLLAELFGEERFSISREEAMKAFKDDIWRIPKKAGSGEMYFQEHNFEELLPRFTQIKNALGIKEFRALTEAELRKAYRLFKQGNKRFASNLGVFFENIKDWKAAAKLSGKALSGAGVGTISYKSLDNGEEVQDYR